MTNSQAAKLSVRLRPVRSAPAAARRLVLDREPDWRLPARLLDDTAMVAGAMVLLSVCQARSPLRLTLSATDLVVLVEVDDSCMDLPSPSRERFSLDLVRRTAQAFWFVQQPAGRQLWARVAAREATCHAPRRIRRTGRPVAGTSAPARYRWIGGGSEVRLTGL